MMPRCTFRIVFFAAMAMLGACDNWGYSEEVKNSFVTSCNKNNTDIMHQVCECSFEEIKKSMPYREFKALDEAMKNQQPANAESQAKVAQAAKTCAARIFVPQQNDKGKH